MILVVFSSTAVCIVSIFAWIPIWCNLLLKAFGTVPKAPITIRITGTFLPIELVILLPNRDISLIFPFTSFQLFDLQVLKSLQSDMYYLSTIIRSELPDSIWWSVCISKSQSNWLLSFYRTDSAVCSYYLPVWANCNWLHNSQW